MVLVGSPVVGGTVAGFLAPVLAFCSLLGVVAAVLTGFTERMKLTGVRSGVVRSCYADRILSPIAVLFFLNDEFASLVKPITKKTVSQSEAHVNGTSLVVGGCGIGKDMMDEEAKLHAVVAGEGAEPAIAATSSTAAGLMMLHQAEREVWRMHIGVMVVSYSRDGNINPARQGPGPPCLDK
ncbi:hypothetical protein HYC85_027771 [Camellia sinensis]|uniref:Uncharacterized protein n=1 Tax=Camellia sinensis TaxID=4442 RepID=A0A7J7FT92_CAMSI|nr:hypothetical protein HYC85_027771 [Camellia sinensis]